MTERAPKMLCAGIAVQDIVMRVDKFPAPGSKVHASDFIVTGGGCAANAAVAAARLDARAGFAGPLGGKNDAVSERILADLAAEGIDCSGVVRLDGGSASVSLILLDVEGEKAIATRRGVGLNHLLPRDARALVADADAVLIDNRFPEFVTAVAHAARARAIPLVIDLDLASKPDDPLLALGTHVIASAEALRAGTGSDDLGAGLKLLAKHVPGFLAVTDGRERRLLAGWRRATKHAGVRHRGGRYARRWRCVPRRLHAGADGERRPDRCAALWLRRRRAQMHAFRRRRRRTQAGRGGCVFEGALLLTQVRRRPLSLKVGMLGRGQSTSQNDPHPVAGVYHRAALRADPLGDRPPPFRGR